MIATERTLFSKFKEFKEESPKEIREAKFVKEAIVILKILQLLAGADVKREESMTLRRILFIHTSCQK